MSIYSRYVKYVGLVAASIILFGCQPPQESSAVVFKVPVTVAKVELSTVEKLVKTSGTLRSTHVVTLRAKTDGVFDVAMGENGPLFEGARVSTGDVIANITGEDARLAAKKQLSLKKLEVARENLEATTKLRENNLVSVERYGVSKNAYEEAKYEYERSINTDNRNRIIAPIDGVIIEMGRIDGQIMGKGQLVSSGQIIAVIAPMDPLIADIDLVGKDITQVSEGLDTKVRFHSWQDQKFEGKVLRIAPVMNEATRTLRAEVQVNNSQRKLKPGMFVEVSVVAQKRENVTVVPRQALTQRGGRTVIFVINGQRVQQRQVELGLGNSDFIEIVNGVEVGERVVVLGLQTLADDMPVRVTGV